MPPALQEFTVLDDYATTRAMRSLSDAALPFPAAPQTLSSTAAVRIPTTPVTVVSTSPPQLFSPVSQTHTSHTSLSSQTPPIPRTSPSLPQGIPRPHATSPIPVQSAPSAAQMMMRQQLPVHSQTPPQHTPSPAPRPRTGSQPIQVICCH